MLSLPIQLLLILSGFLLSLLLGVITWGYFAPCDDSFSLERFDRLLLGLLVVAAFAMGIFLMVVLAPFLL